LSARDDLILKLGRDPVLAHQSLFRHRHTHETPPFHSSLIRDWRSRHPRINTMAFRNGGKSTIAEEDITLEAIYSNLMGSTALTDVFKPLSAVFGGFRNAIIVGSTEKRATERLTAIKYELANNELVADLFGQIDEHTCRVWNEAEVVLPNNVRLAALGKGQSLRGTKFLQWRPDFLFADDIEETEEGKVYTKEDADETVKWFYTVLMPALDPDARIRVNATPLAPYALPMVLKDDPEWLTKIYPIDFIDATGARQATWESRFPLDWVDTKEASLTRLGLHHEFSQEYRCMAEDPTKKVFTSDMFTVVPRIHSWQPCFAMLDPARTTKQTSATTGWAVWSWVTNRLIVWDGGGSLWKPDEIVNKIFEIDDAYAPVAIGVEQDGLEEFLLQPIRHEQLRRGVFIPVRGIRAPKGKIAFIESLQPYFLAKEVTLAKDLPELVKQFLSFPSGRIDAPNALAFSKHRDLFPGQVVYENFSASCVAEDLLVRVRTPCWLALNAGGGVTTGILVQLLDGAIHVIQDYVREGDPGATIEFLVKDAAVEAGEAPRLLAPPHHFADFNRLGLRGAVARLPSDLRQGGAEGVGRDELRALLQRQLRDRPAVLVSARARWTLNAFAAGYAREVDKHGRLADEARPGVYRTLMEGLESFAGLMRVGVVEAPANVRVTEGGQRYVSALPNRTAPLPAKDAAWRADDVISDFGLSARR
jgi:hypothetical protein